MSRRGCRGLPVRAGGAGRMRLREKAGQADGTVGRGGHVQLRRGDEEFDSTDLGLGSEKFGQLDRAIGEGKRDARDANGSLHDLECEFGDFILSERLGSADFDAGLAALDGRKRGLRQIGSVDGTHPGFAITEQIHASGFRHVENFDEVGVEPARAYDCRCDVRLRQFLRKPRFGPRHRNVRHFFGVEHVDIGKLRHTGCQCFVEQVAIGLVVDFLVAESVFLPGYAERRNYKIDTAHLARKRRRIGRFGEDDLVYRMVERDQFFGLPGKGHHSETRRVACRHQMLAQIACGPCDKHCLLAVRHRFSPSSRRYPQRRPIS